MKSKKIQTILERVDKYIRFYERCKGFKPELVLIYKGDYKILRESMSSEQQRIYPDSYPHGAISIVSR